jgi:DNA ligase (NAD+)
MDLLSLEGFKERKAMNLMQSLEKSKDCELDAFLFALGIPNIGRKTARDLASYFKSLDRVQEASMEELTAIPDIGDIVAQSVVEFFSFEENRTLIRKLLEAGVHPREAQGKADGPFRGMSIVVTGTLPSLSRKQAEELIRQSGGTAAGSVSKKTAFVVVGEDAGSKLDKARSLGIEIVDEAELIRRAHLSAQK